MALLGTVTTVLNNLTISPSTTTTSPPGTPIVASIAGLPASGVLSDALPITIDLLLNTTQFTLGPTEGAQEQVTKLVTKSLLFQSPSILDDAPFNGARPGLPFLNLAALPTLPGTGGQQVIDLNRPPASAISGVPGLVGRLTTDVPSLVGSIVSKITGTVSLPVQVPLAISVEWSVRTGADPGSPAAAAGDYVVTADPSLPVASVTLRPETYDLLEGDSPVTPIKRWLHAKVTLAAGDVVQSRNLPSIEISTVSLGIPRIAAFFAYQNFTGPCLILVPERSTLPNVQDFLNALEPLEQVLAALQAFGTFAGFAAGIANLAAGVVTNPHVKFRRQENIANLNDITLVQNDPLTNDMEAEDELSSLLLIGNDGARIQCFNSRDCADGEGWFEVNVRQYLAALVRNLHEQNPAAVPGADSIEVKKAVPGGFPGPNSFGDTLSSVRFA